MTENCICNYGPAMGLCLLKCVIIKDGPFAAKSVRNLMDLNCDSCVNKFSTFVLEGLKQMIDHMESSHNQSGHMLDALLANPAYKNDKAEVLATQVISTLMHDCPKAIRMMQMAYKHGVFEDCILNLSEMCSIFLHSMAHLNIDNEMELHAQFALIEERIHDWIADVEGWFQH